MRMDNITTPDYSRGVITIEKLVPKKNKPRVKKVVSVQVIPITSKEDSRRRGLFNVQG